MQYYHSKSPQKRQEKKQCEKVEICASEKKIGKKGLFFAYRSFLSEIKKISLATDAAHYTNQKKVREGDSQLQAFKMKKSMQRDNNDYPLSGDELDITQGKDEGKQGEGLR